VEGSSDSERRVRKKSPHSKKNRWTFQNVVEQHEKAQINARAEKLSDSERGTKGFLRAYRKARTQICDELSQEDRLRYEKLVDEWNAESVPLNVQRE